MELNTILLIGGSALTIAGIAFLLNKKQTGYRHPIEAIGEKETFTVNSSSPLDKRPAKTAFVENLNLFAPLLKGLDKGTIDKKKWTETIVGLNNEKLIDIWKKAINHPEILLKIIASWGVSYDSCQEFEYMIGREEMYNSIEHPVLKEGYVYKVVAPCWIYTKTGGEKTVIVKGLVKLKNKQNEYS